MAVCWLAINNIKYYWRLAAWTVTISFKLLQFLNLRKTNKQHSLFFNFFFSGSGSYYVLFLFSFFFRRRSSVTLMMLTFAWGFYCIEHDLTLSLSLSTTSCLQAVFSLHQLPVITLPVVRSVGFASCRVITLPAVKPVFPSCQTSSLGIDVSVFL